MKRLYSWYTRIEEIICGTGFILLVLLVFLSAILRFFRFSMSWNIDLAMLLLAWTAFLGADIAWRKGQIIGVDLFTRNLSSAVRHAVELMIYLIVLIGMILIVVFGLRLAWSERLAKFQSMPIPYSLVTLSLVVASFSMIITTIVKVRTSLMRLTRSDGRSGATS